MEERKKGRPGEEGTSKAVHGRNEDKQSMGGGSISSLWKKGRQAVKRRKEHKLSIKEKKISSP